jgi:ribosomal protein S27AE
MTGTQSPQLTAIPVSIDNGGDWQEIAGQISSEAGLPTVVTPELVEGMIGSAVPLLFAATAAGDMDLLRGTFADQVIAQCQRNSGSLAGAQPTAAVIHLTGAPMIDGHPALRVHLAVQVHGAADGESVSSQFWDLQPGAQVTVGQPTCPNCGAPIASGALICGHCGTDVRGVVKMPLVVSRLELY